MLGALDIRVRRVGTDSLLVRPRGTLDGSAVVELRDALLKYVLDEPSAVLVDIDELVVPRPVSLTVFATVRTRTLEWPGVPLLLIATRPEQQELLRASTIQRFVPWHADVGSALATVGGPVLRRSASCRLDGTRAAVTRARAFVAEVTERWHVPTACGPAQAIVTELVSNVLDHTLSPGALRLERREDTLSIAVADDNPWPAVLPEPTDRLSQVSGLHVVSALALAWGNLPASGGGKVVWALVRAPVDT